MITRADLNTQVRPSSLEHRELPAAPPNRVLREGEDPCRHCGSDEDHHEHRDHAYNPLRCWERRR